ncbi:MAG TPA: serine/threonine-protein kinase [Pseudomonadota bacterium]|nr:serine/threonine-protein kinase [Pseudomonadota bacterium]
MGDGHPQKIQSYQIVRKLGEGGMGAVYEGLNPQIGRRAAIKVLLPQYTNDKEQVTRFFNEARASNLVRHPSLVDVYECGYAEDGAAFIIMEFLDGETLRARYKRQGPLGPAVIPIIRQMATALAATHAKNIVHRDLKPDNVMMVADPEVPGGERVKILDFGIAKLLADTGSDAQHVRTRTGTMMGTPVYMSPEQCRGNADVKQPSDVYSLGAMLFEQYAGRPPFVSDGFGELVAMHMFEEAPRLTDVVKGTPPELQQLVASMLAKSPDARPTMTQVAERLSKLPPHKVQMSSASANTAAKGVGTGATTVRYATGQRQTAKTRTVSIVGGATLLLLAGITALLLSKRTTSAPSIPTVGTSAQPAVTAKTSEEAPISVRNSEATSLHHAEPDMGTAIADEPARPTTKIDAAKSAPKIKVPAAAKRPNSPKPIVKETPAKIPEQPQPATGSEYKTRRLD